jgi:predicted SnoaL-like aldol condensation-catalyzing enzyme
LLRKRAFQKEETMRESRIGWGLAATVLAAAASFAPMARAQEGKSDAEGRKRQVVELLKSIETGDPKPVAVIAPKKYIQHNLAAADGLEGFGALLKQLPPNSARVRTVRVLRDGDFVFTHTEYDFFGLKVGFDVFRFEDGKIVEHWDNLAAKAKQPNRSGHTQTDGPTEAKDFDKTEANKTLVRAFYEDILMHGRKENLADYFGDTYIQHSPGLGDGVEGFSRLVGMVATPNSPIKFDKIHKVLGEGDFVLVMSEGSFRGKPSAFYDLFRVEGGKVVEHWDAIETIPPRSEWKNDNGKF